MKYLGPLPLLNKKVTVLPKYSRVGFSGDIFFCFFFSETSERLKAKTEVSATGKKMNGVSMFLQRFSQVSQKKTLRTPSFFFPAGSSPDLRGVLDRLSPRSQRGLGEHLANARSMLCKHGSLAERMRSGLTFSRRRHSAVHGLRHRGMTKWGRTHKHQHVQCNSRARRTMKSGGRPGTSYWQWIFVGMTNSLMNLKSE